MRPVRGRGVLVCVVVGLLTCAACGGGDNDHDKRGKEPSASPSSSVDPDFFTWQQRHDYTEDEDQIARTVGGWDYNSSVVARNPDHSRTELKSLMTEQMFTEMVGKSSQSDTRSRGPETTRLMQIDMGIGDLSATAVWCTDVSKVEIKKTDNDDWQPANKNKKPYSVWANEFIKSPSSPTRWRFSHPVDKPITKDDCADAFDNDKPAVNETGPPSLEN